MWGLLLLILPVSAAAETHEKIQAALDWELPDNTCIKPRMIVTASSVAGSLGDRQQVDVDSYTIRRYEKKEERWQKCVKEYKAALLVELAEMKDCAQYGLTQSQASIILGNMAFLQKVYMSPEGQLDEP